MEIPESLKREFFASDVIFTKDGLAKWQNYKHPECATTFHQVVFWAAHIAGENIIVKYYLDSTAINRNHTHAVVPMNGLTFEEAVYQYWSNN